MKHAPGENETCSRWEWNMFQVIMKHAPGENETCSRWEWNMLQVRVICNWRIHWSIKWCLYLQDTLTYQVVFVFAGYTDLSSGVSICRIHWPVTDWPSAPYRVLLDGAVAPQLCVPLHGARRKPPGVRAWLPPRQVPLSYTFHFLNILHLYYTSFLLGETLKIKCWIIMGVFFLLKKHTTWIFLIFFPDAVLWKEWNAMPLISKQNDIIIITTQS